MSNSKEHSAGITLKPMLYAGQMVKLDEDMEHSSWVKVVQQTKGRLYTQIDGGDGNCWWVMTYRLTLPCV